MEDFNQSLYETTREVANEAIEAGHLTRMDKGAIRALLKLAENIDFQQQGIRPDGYHDNVSIPSFLNYLGELGLTPAARARIQKTISQAGQGEPTAGSKASKLARFQVVG